MCIITVYMPHVHIFGSYKLYMLTCILEFIVWLEPDFLSYILKVLKWQVIADKGFLELTGWPKSAMVILG